MKDLFGYSRTDEDVTTENIKLIDGLKLYCNFISEAEEEKLLNCIDSNVWLADLKRRVQHFGYKYDYKARRLDTSFYIGEIPNWMEFLINRLQEKEIINFKPDQAIVNEYIEDQGISAHIDCEPCFGDTIISISLGCQCVMNFQREQTTKEKDKIPLLISPRTLLVMTGESRFNWYHGIPARKSDKFNGTVYKRNRRVSITFRKVIIENKYL